MNKKNSHSLICSALTEGTLTGATVRAVDGGGGGGGLVVVLLVVVVVVEVVVGVVVDVVDGVVLVDEVVG